jgi:hypothetical protein
LQHRFPPNSLRFHPSAGLQFSISRRRRFVQFRAERDFYAGVWSEAAGSARRLRGNVEDEAERFRRGLWRHRYDSLLFPPWITIQFQLPHGGFLITPRASGAYYEKKSNMSEVIHLTAIYLVFFQTYLKLSYTLPVNNIVIATEIVSFLVLV